MTPTKNPDDRAQVSEAARHIRDALDYAYQHGLHEFGYDPLKVLEAAALTRAPGAGMSGDRDSVIEECARVAESNDGFDLAAKHIASCIRALRLSPPDVSGNCHGPIHDKIIEAALKYGLEKTQGIGVANEYAALVRAEKPDVSGKSEGEIVAEQVMRASKYLIDHGHRDDAAISASRIVDLMVGFALAALARKSPPPAAGEVSDELVDAFCAHYNKIAQRLESDLVLPGAVREALEAVCVTPPPIPEGWLLVPVEPTEEMWGGLARDIVFWDRYPTHGGDALHRHLKSLGRPIPDWLAKEIPDSPQVPPKGTVAACIYKAMTALASSPAVGDGKPKP